MSHAQCPDTDDVLRSRFRLLFPLLTALALVVALAAIPASSLAATGSLLSAFGTSGFSLVSHGSLDVAAAVAIQSDGKIVTAGETKSSTGTAEMISTRMTPAGVLDPTYGNGGIVTVDINGSSCANALVIQPDGKIVLAGAGNGNGALDFAAVRLLPNGALDTSFGTGGVTTVPIGSYAIANGIVLQPDGKLALGGAATVSQNEAAIARLNADGTLDTSFGGGGTATVPLPSAAWGIGLQGDGKLVLAGQQTSSGTQAYMAARFTASGAADTGFGSQGVVTLPVGSWAQANGIGIQPDGRIVISGSAWSSTVVAATVRLNSDGSKDQSFGTGGLSEVPYGGAMNGLTIQGDGHIVLAMTGAAAIRLNPNGGADTSFGSAGVATARIGTTSDAANGVAVNPATGEVVLAGTAIVGGQGKLSVIGLSGDTGTTTTTSTATSSSASTTQTSTSTTASTASTATHTAATSSTVPKTSTTTTATRPAPPHTVPITTRLTTPPSRTPAPAVHGKPKPVKKAAAKKRKSAPHRVKAAHRHRKPAKHHRRKPVKHRSAHKR